MEDTFGVGIDRAMLQRVYGVDPEGERRYSPATVLGTLSEVITDNPDPKHIATSYIKRQNLTMRMSMRRFTQAIHETIGCCKWPEESRVEDSYRRILTRDG